MAGELALEGRELIGNLVFVNGDVDRGSGLELGLFINPTIDNTITEATINEPSGASYARIALADASWSNVQGLMTFAKQTYTGGAGGFVDNIYGYFIATTGTTPRIIGFEVDPNGPRLIEENFTYSVTPQLPIS